MVNFAAWTVSCTVLFSVQDVWLRFTEKTLYIELRYVFVSLHFFNLTDKSSGMEWLIFEKRDLKNLGLRVQLGHGGLPCPCPVPGSSDFIIMHVNGLHRINVGFCDCGSMEMTTHDEAWEYSRKQVTR